MVKVFIDVAVIIIVTGNNTSIMFYCTVLWIGLKWLAAHIQSSTSFTKEKRQPKIFAFAALFLLLLVGTIAVYRFR